MKYTMRTEGDLQDRLLNKIHVDENGSWIWEGSLSYGYGQARWNGVKYRAHRLSYEAFNGPITDGLIVRHMCHNPPCINPAHLRLGTHFDNMKDMQDKGRARGGRKWKTHCIHGHELTLENTFWKPTGQRACRACIRFWSLNRRKRIEAKN